MKIARGNLIRYILCIIGGAIFLGGGLAYSAWKWSLRPVMAADIYTAGEEAWSVEWIETRWPKRLVDPRTLPESEFGPLKVSWPRAEYNARLMYLFYAWLASAGGFSLLLLLFLIFNRPKKRQSLAESPVSDTQSR